MNFNRKTVESGGTVDTQIVQNISAIVPITLHNIVPRGLNICTISSLWDFKGRKVFGTKCRF